MRTRELIRRLARLTVSREIDLVPAETLSDLIECANEALIEVWLRMPPEMRVIHTTEAINTPTSLTVAPTTGRRYVGISLPQWEGCAIQLPDDPQPNRLISENALERPHAGNPAADGLEGSALAWHDAIRICEHASMVSSDVFMEMAGKHSQLEPWPNTYPLWGETTVSPGHPIHFAVRAHGVVPGRLVDIESSRDNTPQLVDPTPGWWLHLLPRPAAAAILRFTLHVQGERLTLADFRTDRRLLLPDRISPFVVRLAEQKVASTYLFSRDDDNLRRAIDREAERARLDLRNLVDSHVTTTPCTVGTPIGW